jgi:GTP-binding protein Era
MLAGKSTLVNRLLGTKISGVSSKRNTTITPQLGGFTSGAAQVLLYDTPGLVDHSVQGSPLERLKSAWATAGMADQLLFIVDAERQVGSIVCKGCALVERSATLFRSPFCLCVMMEWCPCHA